MIYPVRVIDEVGAILDPLNRTTADSFAPIQAIATRPASLDGQTLAVIDNRTNTPLRERLIARLQSMFAIDGVILVLKDTINVAPRPEDWAEVTKRGTIGLALYGA